MESNKVKGLIFPVGGEAQAFLADRDRPYRDIREFASIRPCLQARLERIANAPK